jgi:hypothetical protein
MEFRCQPDLVERDHVSAQSKSILIPDLTSVKINGGFPPYDTAAGLRSRAKLQG